MQYDDTRAAMEFAGLTTYETWMHYCNMGALSDYFEFDAYLHGLYDLAPADADLVSQAVNELIDDLCSSEGTLLCRAPYSWTRELLEESACGAVPEHERAGAAPAGTVEGHLVESRAAETFDSHLVAGLDVSPLTGCPGVPSPPGAPAELLGEILDSGVIGRIFSGERNQR